MLGVGGWAKGLFLFLYELYQERKEAEFNISLWEEGTMRKFITLIVAIFFIIFVLGGAMAFALQPSGAKGTTKTQQKPSSNASATKATSEELAAIKSAFEGTLKVMETKKTAYVD